MQRISQYPTRYPDRFQLYKSSAPYPMNFMQAPSFENQILIDYGGQPMLQGLSTIRGPFMFPVRAQVPQLSQLAYPITHSIPGPYQQSYINKMGSYSNYDIPYYDNSLAEVQRGYYTRK